MIQDSDIQRTKSVQRGHIILSHQGAWIEGPKAMMIDKDGKIIAAVMRRFNNPPKDPAPNVHKGPRQYGAKA